MTKVSTFDQKLDLHTKIFRKKNRLLKHNHSIDRGDGIGQCVCPCGYELDNTGKTCVQTLICPFDVTFWFDGSQNVCQNPDYAAAQKNHMSDLVDFFRREVRTFDARIAAGVYAGGEVAQEISGFGSNDVDQILADVDSFTPTCGDPTVADVFGHFVSSKNFELLFFDKILYLDPEIRDFEI